jgi:sugar phosphate isomerase/epimerase
MHTSRREFLEMSAVVLGAALIGKSFNFRKENIRLAFSTLACPDWTFSQIVEFAASHGYTGIELRGVQRQLDLPKCNEFATEQKRKETLALMKDKGLRFVDLGSSATMHLTDAAERKKTMDEGKSFIDLAVQIGSPYVRVYPNKFPQEMEKDKTMELIASGLKELGDYAKDKNVMVLMETHGDAVWIEDILKIMQLANHKKVGLVWDICNMWTMTKETPAEMYKKLGKYIRHTHIKDAKMENNAPKYVFLGKGEVPIFDAIDILRKNKYNGYYSFEWEKLWHPELAEPELALADFPEAMNKHFQG